MGLLKDKDEEAFTPDEQKMVEHELAIAADIQENLMPRRIPQIPGYEVMAYYKPSQLVGGDYYDFIDLQDARTGFLVADVSGKGVPGALVMVQTRAYIRASSGRYSTPKELATRINALLNRDIPRGMFVTMFYIQLDPGTSLMTCLSAGHNPMVLWRSATQSCHIVNPNGIALGIDKGPIFERTVTEQAVRLNPGDRVVLYTDGLVEAMDADDQEYSSMRFYRNVARHAQRESAEFLSLIVKDVQDFVGEREPSDDLTVVTIRRLGSPDGQP